MNEEISDLSELVEAEEEKDAVVVYELGYHLLPSLEEDALGTEEAHILSLLKKMNAEIVGSRAPAKIRLAYTIEKKVDGVLRSFDEAYFGWIAFEGAPHAIASLDEALKVHGQMLRHLIIKTSRDAVVATLADPSLDIGAFTPPVAEEEPSPETELDVALEHIEEKEGV